MYIIRAREGSCCLYTCSITCRLLRHDHILPRSPVSHRLTLDSQLNVLAIWSPKCSCGAPFHERTYWEGAYRGFEKRLVKKKEDHERAYQKRLALAVVVLQADSQGISSRTDTQRLLYPSAWAGYLLLRVQVVPYHGSASRGFGSLMVRERERRAVTSAASLLASWNRRRGDRGR